MLTGSAGLAGVIALLALGTCAAAVGPPTVALEGRVLDADGAPLPNARVEVRIDRRSEDRLAGDLATGRGLLPLSEVGHAAGLGTTNEAGWFSITALEGGDGPDPLAIGAPYLVRVIVPDHYVAEERVQLERTTSALEFELHRRATLDDLVPMSLDHMCGHAVRSGCVMLWVPLPDAPEGCDEQGRWRPQEP